MTRKQRRATFIVVSLGILGLAVGMVLMGLRDNVTYFYSPSDVAERGVEPGKHVRIGGLVEAGSKENLDDATVKFVVTDFVETITVTYRGVLPDLFREGQGVVTEGSFGEDGNFTATKVLAKHDEYYMPPEVADALKKSGQWQGEGADAPHAETYGQGSYP